VARKRFEMSEDHKRALAEGRAQGRAVRAYLAGLEEERSSARRPDPAALERRVEELKGRIDDEPDPTKRVELIQKRLDLESDLATASDGTDIEVLEADFVEAAAPYSERKGITYPAWRELGVPAAVLKRAGIKRTRATS
jgi:hypothetical protein